MRADVRKFGQRLPIFYSFLFFLVLVIAILFEESEVELVLFICFRRRLTVFLRRPSILYIVNISSFVLALAQYVLIFI